MRRYLLDTNHLSAYLDRCAPLEQRIDDALKAGDRVGLCLPVLCEYRAGIRLGRRYQRNLARLHHALGILRIWPMDEGTAVESRSRIGCDHGRNQRGQASLICSSGTGPTL